MPHDTRSAWAYKTPDLGDSDGRTADAAWLGAVFCAATQAVSVIRTLSSTSEYLPGRARSVLAANISNGLQGYRYSDQPPIASRPGTIHRRATGPVSLCSHKV